MDASASKSNKRWRFSSGKTQLAVTEKWNPLEDLGPPPEYIPDRWDGPHVGTRLSEAFKTLACLPGGFTRAGLGYWPEVWHEWEDLLAQEEADASLKEERTRAANRVRVRPTAQDVTRMETAIIWPGRYIHNPVVSRIVQRIALYRSREMDMSYVARRMRYDLDTLLKRNNAGLNLIASGLRRDGVVVF